MACGTPVISSNTSSLPEAVGDAALLVDPSDRARLVDAMAAAVTDKALRDEPRERGLQQAKRFSWDETARLTLRVYEGSRHEVFTPRRRPGWPRRRMTRPPDRWASRVVLGLSLILAVCAFVPSAIWIVEQPWYTGVWEDDDATIELLTRDAGRGRHWIGPYSRFRWNHPGPVFFYAVWPVYWLSGEKPAAARLVPLFINVACAVGIVLIVRRYFGAVPAVIAGAGIAVLAAHLGASIVASLWNPYSTILPFALTVCLAFGATMSGGMYLPLTVLAASFVVQTHVAYVPTVAAVVAVPMSRASREHVRVRASSAAGTTAGDTRRSGRWLLAAAGTGLVLWTPPLIDQLAMSPGNLTLLWNFFTTERGSHSLADVIRKAAPNVSGVLLRIPLMIAERYEEPTPSLPAKALLLALIVALGFALGRSRCDALRTLVALTLAALLLALAAATRIVGDLHPYLFTWMCSIGLLGWMAVAIFAWQSWARRSSRTARALILASAAVLSLFAARWNVLFAASMPPMRPLPYVGALSNAVIQSTKHDLFVIALRDETWIWAGGLLNELDRRGVAFRVPPQWTFMFGKSRAPRGDERVRLLLADAHAHAELLGRSDLSLIAAFDEKLVFRQLDMAPPGATAAPAR
jgi:hypothetical protein